MPNSLNLIIIAVRNSSQCFLNIHVDASNVFNSLNRLTGLHNTRWLCTSVATILIHSYRNSAEYFLDGDIIGGMQGDPLAMSMYAIASIPLIRKLGKKALSHSMHTM